MYISGIPCVRDQSSISERGAKAAVESDTHRHLPDSPPQLSITRSDNVALARFNPIDDAVIGVGAFMAAR